MRRACHDEPVTATGRRASGDKRMAMPSLISDPVLVTSEWLTDVLRHGGAVDGASKLHGPLWGDPALRRLAWLDRSSTSGGLAGTFTTVWGLFLERYRSTLEDVTIDEGARLASLIERLRAFEPAALTAIHYDY